MARHFHSLQSDAPNDSSTHLTPYSYYATIGYIPYAVLTSLGLFCNYQFVLFNPFTFLTQPPNTLPLWEPPVYSLYL